MKEADFQAEFAASARAVGAFYHKIADFPHGSVGGHRFAPKRPFDAIMLINGHFWALEFKLARGTTCRKSLSGEQRATPIFRRSDVTEEQLKALNQVIDQGGNAAVVVRFPGRPPEALVLPPSEIKGRTGWLCLDAGFSGHLGTDYPRRIGKAKGKWEMALFAFPEGDV